MHPTPSILSLLRAKAPRFSASDIEDVLFSDNNEVSIFLKSQPLNPYELRYLPAEKKLRLLREPRDSFSLLGIDSYWGQIGGDGYRELPTKIFIDLLLEAFVKEIRIEAPEALASLQGKPCIYVGNHQTYIESVLIGYLLTAINKNPFLGVAKVAHASLWLGRLYAMLSTYPGLKVETEIYLVDRDNPSSLLQSITDLRHFLKDRRKSVFVHLEGRRQRQANCKIEKVSSLWSDLSIDTDSPIVPLRFIGGLPNVDTGRKFDFPYRYGKQSILIGTPILPQDMKKLPLKERTNLIKDRINGLNQVPDAAQETGNPLESRILEFVQKHGLEEDQAVFLALTMNLKPEALGESTLGRIAEAASTLLRGSKEIRLQIPSGEKGQWWKLLGEWLFRTTNASFEASV